MSTVYDDQGRLSWLAKVLLYSCAHTPVLQLYPLMSICFQSSYVALPWASQVLPIFISALMQPLFVLPPLPPCSQTLICGKIFICTPEHAFKWWMENVKHCIRLLFPFSYDADWHQDDLSLWDFIIFSVLLLSLHFWGWTHADPSPPSFLYVYSTSSFFFF